MMNVLMLSPGFPGEMVHFTRGLARVGARVIGLGDQPAGMLPPPARDALDEYVHVPSLWDEASLIETVRGLARGVTLDRIECLWEPGMLTAARLREALGVPGMGVEQTTLFRDKEAMKLALDRAGLRTPRHARGTDEQSCRAAAERIGYPLIVKPIAGAGSADTYRVDSPAELDRVLPLVRHHAELSVEEFIEGEELTYDTICADGRVLFENVAWYRPQPLIARTVEWISPQTVSLRDPQTFGASPGVELGRRVLEVLGFRTGFTHMEWFLTASGEAVFGEIAGRPPGAMSVDVMNWASEVDTFTGWAEAVCRGRIEQPRGRRYNAAVIFKRAQGSGQITRIEGLGRLVARYRPHIVSVDLLPPGAPRRNWKQTLLSDGQIGVRHPDLAATLEMADRFGTDLQLFAGG